MQTTDTRYQAQARATLGGELGTLADHLTHDQLQALATEVVTEVLANDRGFGEYVTEYVANITASSVSDADRLRKVRSYADILLGGITASSPEDDDNTSDTLVQPVTPDPWKTGAAMDCPTCGEYVREGDDCTQGHYARGQEETPESDLEVCTDCAHLLANGETPEDDPEFSLLESWNGYVLALVSGTNCEPWFSWSRCDGCGSTLGGDRHPAAVIEEPPTKLDEFTEAFPGVPEAVLFTLTEGHPDYSPEDFSYEGEFYSYADLANHMVEEGLFGEIPEHLARYMDIDAIGRDLDCEGVYEIRHNFTGYYWTIH